MTQVERCALVTGASQGIGRATALSLAEAGYVVWAVARRGVLLASLSREVSNGRIIAAPYDLTDPAAIGELAYEVATRTPKLQAVVHCAGSIVHGSVADTAVSQLRGQLRDNVEAAYALTQAVLPSLVPAASIVFLNSSQGIGASAHTSQYAASMHARKAIADALRAEVNERGIRVTSIYPGRTATPRQAAIYADHDWTYTPELLLQPEDIAQLVLSILELPATAEVTDLSIRPAIKSY